MSKVTNHTNEEPVMAKDRYAIIAGLRSVIANLIQGGVLTSLPNEAADLLKNLNEGERLTGDPKDIGEVLTKAVENFTHTLAVAH
ncbi:hypothetical protein [Shimazuella kribbensis]|uniref:hypothetical protein n=1 Tax=Shimazuella kribbensis TaxID=139808 RepID=UPI00048D6248|nr:hypothetical protein [Shimazuella kribbensis]